MNNPKYSYGVFQHHFLKVKKFLPDNFTLCELGSGDSISTALIAPCFGSSKTYLIDNGNFATRDISEYKKLYDFLTKKGFNGLVFDTSFDFNDILLNNNSYYLTKGINDLKKLETNSIDFVFSQATLEHIAFHDFIATQEQIHRILKPSGIVSHNIDLRDHLVGGLNNLRFSERIWEFDLMAKSGFYTNRIRYSQMLNIFKKTGFNVDAVIIETWDKLPIPRSKLSHDFRNLSDKDLCVSVFDVLLKPK
jgi:SAM-dependent methyltransferase